MFFTTLVCSLGAVGRNTNEKTFEKLIGKLGNSARVIIPAAEAG